MNNLFANVPRALREELTNVLAQGKRVRIERIVSTGHVSPPGFWYDQPEHEWVAVLRGAARLEFSDRIVELGAGDYLLIPARERHRVAWTSPEEATVWLAVDEASYTCDACGEEIVVPLDVSAGESQAYIEDCPVCCRPNLVHVELDGGGEPRVWAEPS